MGVHSHSFGNPLVKLYYTNKGITYVHYRYVQSLVQSMIATGTVVHCGIYIGVQCELVYNVGRYNVLNLN